MFVKVDLNKTFAISSLHLEDTIGSFPALIHSILSTGFEKSNKRFRQALVRSGKSVQSTRHVFAGP